MNVRGRVQGMGRVGGSNGMGLAAAEEIVSDSNDSCGMRVHAKRCAAAALKNRRIIDGNLAGGNVSTDGLQ